MDTITPQLGSGGTDRVHRASPRPVAILGVRSSWVRQGLRVLGDLAVQPVQLGQTLLEMCQEPADLGGGASQGNRGGTRVG